MTNVFTADALARFSQLGPPQTIADIAALSALGVASAAYLLRGIAWDRPDPYHHVWFERMGSKNGTSSGPKATRDIAKKLEETVSYATEVSSEYVLTSSRARMLSSFGALSLVQQKCSPTDSQKNAIFDSVSRLYALTFATTIQSPLPIFLKASSPSLSSLHMEKVIPVTTLLHSGSGLPRPPISNCLT